MAESKKDKAKFMKKFLTTASALAVLAGGAGEAMGVAAARTHVNTGKADFNVGTHMDGGNPFITNSTFEFLHPQDIDANSAVNVLAMNLNAIDHAAANVMEIAEDVSFGSIVDLNGDDTLQDADNSKRVNFKMTVDNKTVELTGTDSGALGFVAAGVGAPANNYDALGAIDFNAKNATTLKVAAAAPIVLSKYTTITAGNAGLTLDVDSDLTVNSTTFATIGNWDIAAGKKFEINAGNNDIVRANGGVGYVFGDGDSTLIFKIDGTGGKTLDLQADHITPGGDDDFSFEISSTAAGGTVTVNDSTNAGVTIGKNAGNRARLGTFSGPGNITLTNKVDVFARAIDIKSSGTVTFTNDLSSGDNNNPKLTFKNNGTASFLGTVKIEDMNFNGHDATLKIADGKDFIKTAGGGAAAKITNDPVDSLAIANPIAAAFDVGGKTAAQTDAIIQALAVKFGPAKAASTAALANGDNAQMITKKAIEAMGGGDAQQYATFATTAGGGAAANVAEQAKTPHGILNLAGTSTVVDTVGAANRPLLEVKLSGDNTKKGTFNGDIVAKKLTIVSGSAADFKGNSIFDTGSGFAAANAKTIKIGVGAARTLELNSGENDIDFGQSLDFANAGSSIKLGAKGGNAPTYTLSGGDFAPTAAGNIILHAEGDDGAGTDSQVTLTADASRMIGSAATAVGVTASGDKKIIITDNINLSEVPAIQVADATTNGTILELNDTYLLQSAGVDTDIIVGNAGGKVGTAIVRLTNDRNLNEGNVKQTALKTVGSKIQFKINNAAHKLTLLNHFDPDSNDQGIVELTATGTSAPGVKSRLTLEANTGAAKTFGVGLRQIRELIVSGDGEVYIGSTTSAGNNLVDLANVKRITVAAGATLRSNHTTPVTTFPITIGEADAVGQVPGTKAATLEIDAVRHGSAAGTNLDLNSNAAGDIVFGNPLSVLRLSNTEIAGVGGNNRIFRLVNNLAPAANDTGIIELLSPNKSTTVRAQAAQTLGTNANKLKEIRMLGGSAVLAENMDVHALTISVKDGLLTAQNPTATTVPANIVLGDATNATDGTFNFEANANVNILAANKKVRFDTENSVFQISLLPGGGADKTVTLAESLVPRLNNTAGDTADVRGKVVLKNDSAGGHILKINAAAGKLIGLADKRFKELKVEASEPIEVNVPVFAKNILVNGGSEAVFSQPVVTDTFGATDVVTDKGELKIDAANTVVALVAIGNKISEVKLNDDNFLVMDDDATLLGSVDNITGADGKGLVSFEGSGAITGNIGKSNSLKGLQFKGDNTKTVTIDGSVVADQINFGDESNAVINGDITGNIVFDDEDGKLIFKGTKLDGYVDTNTTDNKGTLEFNNTTANAEVIGDIGQTRYLKQVIFNTDKTVTLNQDSKAGIFKFSRPATVVMKADAQQGVFDFAGVDGTVIVDGGDIVGADNSQAGTIAGTVDLRQDTTFTGATGGTNPISGVIIASGKILELQGNADVRNFNLPADGIIVNTNPVIMKTNQISGGSLIVEGNLTVQGINGATVMVGSSATRLTTITGGNGGNAYTATFTNAHIYTNLLRSVSVGAGDHLSLVFKGNDNLLVNTNNWAVDDKLPHTIDVGTNADVGNLLVGSNLAVNNRVRVFENSTLTFGSNVTDFRVATPASGIIGGAANKGTVRFENDSPLTLHGGLGTGAAKLDTAIFAGHNVIIDSGANNIGVNNIEFAGDMAIRVEKNNGVDLSGIAFTNSGSSSENVIAFKGGDIKIDTQFGTALEPIGFIEIENGRKVQIDTGEFHGGVIGGGKVEVNMPNSGLLRFGTFNGTKLEDIVFAGDSTVLGGTHAKNIKINPNFTVIFNDKITTDNGVTLGGLNSTARFGKGVNVDFGVKGTGNEGIAQFAGNNNISVGTFGTSGLKAIQFLGGSSSSTTISSGNFNATTTSFDGGVFNIQKDLQLRGATISGSTLNLNSSKVTASADPSSLSGEITINSTLKSGSIGNLVFSPTGGNKVDFNGVQKVKVIVDDTAEGAAASVTSFNLITTAAGTDDGFDLNDFSVTGKGSLTEWTIDASKSVAGNLVIIQEDQTGDKLEQFANDFATPAGLLDAGFGERLENAAPGTEGAILKMQLNSMTPENANDANVKLQNPITVGPALVSQVGNITSSVVSSRIGGFTSPVVVASFNPTPAPAAPVASPAATIGTGTTVSAPAATSPGAGPATTPGTIEGGSGSDQLEQRTTGYIEEAVTGLSAGDRANHYGIWVNPFYVHGDQDRRGDTAAGYRTQTLGASFGFDVLANEDTLLGAAVTLASTDVSHKDFKSGDKTRVATAMGSLYSVYQINDYYFLQGMMFFGSSDVTNKERKRVANNSVLTSKGTYNSMSFGADVIGGYNFPLNRQVVITPMAGLGFSKINDASYKETGVPGQNRDIDKKSSAKVDLIAGVRVATVPFIFKEASYSPEFHAMMRHDVRGDASKVTSRIDLGGADPQNNVISSRTPKTSKTVYNAGFGVTAGYSSYEYGFNYDAQISDKFVGHQGSVKVRVNF